MTIAEISLSLCNTLYIKKRKAKRRNIQGSHDANTPLTLTPQLMTVSLGLWNGKGTLRQYESVVHAMYSGARREKKKAQSDLKHGTRVQAEGKEMQLKSGGLVIKPWPCWKLIRRLNEKRVWLDGRELASEAGEGGWRSIPLAIDCDPPSPPHAPPSASHTRPAPRYSHHHH